MGENLLLFQRSHVIHSTWSLQSFVPEVPATITFISLEKQDYIPLSLDVHRTNQALLLSCRCFFFNITWGWVKMGYARVLQPATPNTVFSNRASAKARCLYSLPDSEWKWTPHPATVNTSLNSALRIRKHNHCKLNINENPAKGLKFKITYVFPMVSPSSQCISTT